MTLGDTTAAGEWLGGLTIIAPVALLAALGISPLIAKPLSERATARWTSSCVACALCSALAIFIMMLVTGSRYVPVEWGDWVSIPEEHFHFHLKFVFDRLSVPFVILTLTLVGAVGSFANRYLHREPGYRRFFLSFAIFLVGMVVASLAGTIETLFLGWELVGLSSSLLVAFFHERKAPVINAQRIWSVYRVADAAFLIAAVVLHHLSGSGDFDALMGAGHWPNGQAPLTSGQALSVGLLLLMAAAGKSALIPFSGWLPRAMEGPTASSAVFYGALSVHLGAFLLLRVSPILELSFALQAAIVVLGLATAGFAAIASRVQTDAKNALAYASLTQVGIITAEIGLGLRYIPLIHIIGHACLRTLQILRTPSLLQDHHMLENAIGGRIPRSASLSDRWIGPGFRLGLYRFGLHRGQFDSILDRFVVAPFIRVFRWCDRMERSWTNRLAGTNSRRSDQVVPSLAAVEED